MICPYCDAPVTLRDSSIIYGGRSFGDSWICTNFPKCDSYVGCHPGTSIPLGSVANAELRSARALAHRYFDVLWKRKVAREKVSKGHARRKGYAWLAEKLGIPVELCHIAMFNLNQCLKTAEICGYKKEAFAS